MRKLVGRALLVVLAVVLGVLVLDLSPLASGTVEFVVPDGTTGGFLLRESSDGVAWRRDGFVEAVDVPASGVVLVDTSGPVHRWHVSRARFAGGAPLEREHVSDAMKRPEDGVVRFYGCWSDDRGDDYYFVGTRSALRSVYRANRIAPGMQMR